MMGQAIVVMGVSGCGKSTLGLRLAETLNCRFVEGDDLHPRVNIAKMSRGEPLTDQDRQPFLQNVADALRDGDSGDSNDSTVVTCSALKRHYRDVIRRTCPRAVFVLQVLSREELFARLEKRRNHFMPAALLESQLAIFEPPAVDESAIIVDGLLSLESQVEVVLGELDRVRSR